ncbi:RNA-binding protein RO60 [Parasteatoda tepidariorum]|uniref:RNA-binding protein RO60 n=1 Tax=Parasteatoda tepidariorum TaxID=114398 RepID=UPI00077FB5A0|nr:60 kDa SS-A/Ro ribonucleoprotein [Parasteatoda tepidariorum]
MAETTKDANLIQLSRFLYLGDESKMYPDSVKYPFNPETCQFLKELMQSGLVQEAVEEVIRSFKEGHFIGCETLLYVLAVFAHPSNNSYTKGKAFEAAAEICSSASNMLTFIYIFKDVIKPLKGWGRMSRNFLINWYVKRDPKDLAMEVTRVKSRHKWTHKDVLCMAHVKPSKPGSAAVLKAIVKGLECAEKEFAAEPEAEPILNFLKGVHEVVHATDPQAAARLIEIHNLCLEHIPDKIIKSKEVSLCIIPRVPLPSLLNQLPRYHKVGLLKLNSPHYKAALERLTTEEALNSEDIGPLDTFLAIRRWQISCKPMLRQSTPALDDALQNLHLESFKRIRTTEKRYLVAIDVGVSMNLSKCSGCNAVTPSHIGDIVLMALVRSELSNVTALVFSENELVQVDINHKMTLVDIVERLNEVPAGPIILSAPINYALTKKLRFDAFVVFSDINSKADDSDLVSTMKEYKETMRLPNTRYVLSTLCDRKSTFTQEGPDFLNIVGFHTKLVQTIQDFTCGLF